MLKLSLLLMATLSFAAPEAEFIFEKPPTPSCHASTIVETSPGEFMAAWFGGTAEGRPDVAIWAARRSGGRWSEAFELAREPQTATYNPVLFFSPDGTLWLYYKFGPSPQQWTGGRRFSRDRGRTWSAVEHLPAGVYGPIKNKPLLLAGGAIVSGTSVESYRSWACWVERSTDNARNWARIGPITADAPAQGNPALAAPSAVPDSAAWRRITGIIQPAIVPLGKRLRMYARATQDIGRICYADSSDEGLTWTSARATSLPNPNSGIDAVALRDGRIVMIYNHTASGRTPLNAAVSRDGEHWKPAATLEDGPGEFSYPAVIQSADGAVHITYTWKRLNIKHVVLSSDKLP